eukprot:TRINITY_DN2085_c0_g1_i1.p1 TRINITY_DN2085_c0_g1~~TRINITY_DN2085_c0_g1_i1.p1  ORF type:complete len:839 (-),score=151.85 TRINITY_DN2085_c0_g1_i1:54-2570(-)
MKILTFGFFLCIFCAFLNSEAPEPFPWLNNYKVINEQIPASPDPLVNYQWLPGANFTNLQLYTLLPVSVTATNQTSFSNLNSLLTKTPNVEVHGQGSIMLEFAQENPAWIEIDSTDLSQNTDITMSVSEYNEVWMLGPTGPKRKAPTKYGNTYRLELNAQLYEGVRYAWITSLTDRTWHITGLRLVCQAKPVSYVGSFNSSNDMLNKVWYTGAFTVRQNLEVDYFGAILMNRGDRISWTGDAHTAQAAALVAFGNFDFIKENILRTQNDSNGIESYALYWVLSICDYAMFTGDFALIVSQLPYITRNLAHAQTVYGHATLTFFGWDDRLGSGFKDASCAESQLDYQMLVIRTLYEVATVLEHFKIRPDLVKQYSDSATNYVQKLRSDESWYLPFGLHASADAINAGFTTPVEKEAIFDQNFKDVVNICSYSPFNMYWILQALGRMNKIEQAIYVIEHCWGGMIKLGATSYWEIFSPEWVSWFIDSDYLPEKVPNGENGWTSLSHPWGAGVTYWLSTNLLGIKPTAPGFSRFDAKPQLGSMNFIEGSVPTPRGEISLRVDMIKGRIDLKVPKDSIARVGVPSKNYKLRRIVSININDIAVWPNNEHNTFKIDFESDESFILISEIPSGIYHIHCEMEKYPNLMPFVTDPFPPARYSGQYIGKDTTTKGNWLGKYGKDGYVLFHYLGSDDLSKLPSYVSQVQVTWGAGKSGPFPGPPPENDIRGLENPSGTHTRNIGCYYNELTFVLDITLRQEQSNQISMYLVDWDYPNGIWTGGGGKGRREIIRVMDLETKNVVAPSQVVEDFYGGVYLIFRYDKSIRLRFSTIGGDNAVVSALFWDS